MSVDRKHGPERGEPRMPWDEKPGPTPNPERVEIPRPWDEKVASPIPKLGKRPKRGQH
jgi:hypothetical protein